MCRNCGAELSGPWCAQCGQHGTALRPTVGELLHEAFHELSHLDGKVLRTVSLLLTKPGELTREFLAGRRVRYVSPIRLYLICSLLFFGLMSVMPARPLHVRISNAKAAHLEDAAARMQKDPSILSHALESAFPKAMFILMPLFGLIVLAFEWRAERMYVPHFYFAVHYHAFAFLVVTLLEASSFIHSRIAVIPRLFLLIWLFPYLAMSIRRVYGGSRLLATLKSVAILTIYCVFILLAMALIALVTLLRL
jgi:hypothetical protein